MSSESELTDARQDSRDKHVRRASLNRKLQLAFLEGAEVSSRTRLGRGLSEDEHERVLRRCPGDLPPTKD
jgi:hypothetical protein